MFSATIQGSLLRIKETETSDERVIYCERVGGVYLLMKLVGHPSFITKLGTGKIEMASLWLILPALLTAFVIGNAYQWLQAALAKICQPFEGKQSILVSLGAACIFLLLF